MNLFFLLFDSAFFWDRAGMLARHAKIHPELAVSTLFGKRRFCENTYFVFNRFCVSPTHRLMAWLCRTLEVPYVVDIDDLFWELPSFSSDRAADDGTYALAIESLTRGAAVITTPSAELGERIRARYPHTPVVLVENCPPPWIAPAKGALIANTDSFKMNDEETRWFSDILRLLYSRGLAIQLVGENNNLLRAAEDLLLHEQPRLELLEYLRFVADGRFSLGLVPVAHSAYAQCKSPIKLLEFLSQRMVVIASDVAPYRRFHAEHPGLRLAVVENSFATWKAAVEEALALFPPHELEEGARINEMLARAATRQVRGWQEVAAILSAHPVRRNTIRVLHVVYAFFECARNAAANLKALVLLALGRRSLRR